MQRAVAPVDGGTAVQLLQDEFPDDFVLFRDDADPALEVLIKDEVVQDNTGQIRSENAENDCFLS